MLESYSAVISFFQDGGLFIYPIGLVFAVGVAIAIERWLYLTRQKMVNHKAFGELYPFIRSNERDKLVEFTRSNNTAVSRMIGAALDMLNVSHKRSEVEHAMTEGVMEAMPQLEQRTGYLAVLANVATLLGLLGTIIGLIAAFTAVANADPAEKSQLLSSSISVAMNTTAFGLISAIPLLLAHAMLQNKTTAIVASIEMAGVKFLNTMTMNKVIADNAQPVATDTASSNAAPSLDAGTQAPSGA